MIMYASKNICTFTQCRLIASIPTLVMNQETEMWHEDIADLWKGQLQHLRDFNYSHDPTPIPRGFGEVQCIENGLREDIQVFDAHNGEQPPPLIQLIDFEISEDGKQTYYLCILYVAVHYCFKFQLKQFCLLLQYQLMDCLTIRYACI